MIHARSVYELEGACEGKRLWVVAPGPSSEAFAEYRQRIAWSPDTDEVLAINSAIEFTDPRWWLWSDRRFASIYGNRIHETSDIEMVVTRRDVPKMQLRFGGKKLWMYDCQMKLRPWEGIVGGGRVFGKPFWYSPTRRFLPGRASAANVALSFAWLLAPRVCIVVGVDWAFDDKYYNTGVHLNVGPTNRERALAAGRRFFRSSMKSGIWGGMMMVTVSRSLAAEGVKHVTWDEAIEV